MKFNLPSDYTNRDIVNGYVFRGPESWAERTHPTMDGVRKAKVPKNESDFAFWANISLLGNSVATVLMQSNGRISKMHYSSCNYVLRFMLSPFHNSHLCHRSSMSEMNIIHRVSNRKRLELVNKFIKNFLTSTKMACEKCTLASVTLVHRSYEGMHSRMYEYLRRLRVDFYLGSLTAEPLSTSSATIYSATSMLLRKL